MSVRNFVDSMKIDRHISPVYRRLHPFRHARSYSVGRTGCLRKIQDESLVLQRGDEADMICHKPHNPTNLQSQNLYYLIYYGQGDMRHAAAGNALTLKTATSASQLTHSHTYAAQPAAVGMSTEDSPLAAAMESQADGPARCSRCWTPVSVTPFGEGNTERICNTPHPLVRAEGAFSEPASSQPG
jgi:hypothetical protein